VTDLANRSFVKELDCSAAELTQLLDLAAALRDARRAGVRHRELDGRSIALLFEKTSTRTRAAFEVAAHEEGADVTYLDPAGSQLAHKESIADTARVLGRLFDAIVFRGSAQADVEELAARAGVPVINGLTDEWHPTQMLADFLTMREAAGKPCAELSYAYVGDCRFNMGRSLLVTGAILGADVRLAGPAALQPPPDVVEAARERAARTGARLTVTDDPREAVAGVDFVHTDVWVSMGEDQDVWVQRVEALRAYQVNTALLAASGNPRVRFMHCLPAYHDRHTVVGSQIMTATGMAEGLEVTDEVFDSPASVVFDQAENRLHTARALLVATLA
jgi:ornithine carbamoyltransferase